MNKCSHEHMPSVKTLPTVITLNNFRSANSLDFANNRHECAGRSLWSAGVYPYPSSKKRIPSPAKSDVESAK
jgi:hypothetical protein